MAQQCFLNEYVYFQGEDEEQALVMLCGQLSCLSSPPPEAWTILATVACSIPLCDLKLDGVALSGAPSQIIPLIRQQIQEPAQEAAIGEEFCDKGQSQVRSCSEPERICDALFQRWTHTFAESARPFRDVLRGVLPHLGAREVAQIRRPRILVAGCGTGLPIFAVLGTYEGASIVAIDGSLENLAYAKRKLMESGDTDVELRRWDANGLQGLNEQFDLIRARFLFRRDALSVMGSLAKLLKSGGFFRFHLHSAETRRAISRVHSIVERSGADAVELRSLRRDLMLSPVVSEIDVLKSPASDFWTTSACRELLFPVGEQSFALTEVGDLLKGLHFEFLGLELNHAFDRARFAAEHPAVDAPGDIEAWRRFEGDHPEIFGGGFVIWARKKYARR